MTWRRAKVRGAPRATESHFAPDGQLLAMLAVICRRLDGIPLAIELAAARAAALGIEELASRLDERFNLLTGGRRTALPRHQTLRATLDWSYELLAEPERILLRRLAIFAGPFSLDAASAVATNPELARSEVIGGIASLVAKSLVAPEVWGVARYRLLDTTRAYAFEKLSESGEREGIARCHAAYYRDRFEQAEAEWEVRSTAEWIGEYGWRIDDLRAALDWAFSADGDATLGVALTAAAIPLWMQLAELLRIKGDLAGSESETTAIAESLFSEALDVARGQGAVSFELRAATSLARLLRDRGRSSDALACLRQVYDRFTEGFDTADLKKAKLLLDSF